MPAPGKTITDALAALENGSLQKLDVRYGDEGIPKPGARLANKTVVPEPTITSTGLTLNTTKPYLLFLIDLDAPHPSFPIMSPIVHWLKTDLYASPTSTTLTSTTSTLWNYRGAGPPPFSPPHRYVFLLYEQPDGFDGEKYRPVKGKEMAIWPRVRWDHEGFEREVGLGGVVAANWFVAGAV